MTSVEKVEQGGRKSFYTHHTLLEKLTDSPSNAIQSRWVDLTVAIVFSQPCPVGVRIPEQRLHLIGCNCCSARNVQPCSNFFQLNDVGNSGANRANH